MRDSSNKSFVSAARVGAFSIFNFNSREMQYSGVILYVLQPYNGAEGNTYTVL